MHLQKYHNNLEIQKWGCGSIQNLACNVACTTKLLSLDVLSIVVNAVCTFPNDAVVQVCIYMYMRICVHICIYIFVYACVYMHVCVYVYIYTCNIYT